MAVRNGQPFLFVFNLNLYLYLRGIECLSHR